MDFELASSLDVQDTAKPGRSNLQKFDQIAFHRWYNFVLGFSDQLVQPLLEMLSVTSKDVVLDPFCGTGTTLVECAKSGITAIGLDANPFAVFSTKVKCDFDLDPAALLRAATRVEERYRTIVSSNRRFTDDPTYIYLSQSGMLERGWISKRPLRKALALREAIQRGQDKMLADALMLALVADLPTNIGNMKFGPQIYRGPLKEDVDPLPLFCERVKAMAQDLRNASERQSYPKPITIVGDARNLKPALRKHYGNDIPAINFVICSPPYPTEHDYTRHTRLELAFTQNISTLACLRRIKRTMIRSHTKGIYQGDADDRRVESLVSIERLANKVQRAIKGKESGFEKLYPTVVRSYFGGMRRHFGSLFRLLESGGKAAYVVGDQAAYLRIPIRTAVLLGETAESVGFKVQGIRPWRRRWATGISDYLDENILFLSKP
jgi:hypothetical protein